MDNDNIQQSSVDVSEDINSTAVPVEMQTESQPEQTESQPETEKTSFADMSDDERIDYLAQYLGDSKDETSESEPSEGGETPPEAEPTEDQSGVPDSDIYTYEEFNRLSVDEVDPSRLPQAAQDVDKKYRAWFNSNVVPELQQLKQLREYYQRTQQNQQAQQPTMEQQRQMFYNEVQRRTTQALGTNEIDPSNIQHIAELQAQSTMLINEVNNYQRQQYAAREKADRVINAYNELRSEIPNLDEINMRADAELQNLPMKTANKVLADLKSGNPEALKNVYRMFAKRFAQQDKVKNGKREAPKAEGKVTVPPKVIKGSNAKQETKAWDYAAFADGDDEHRKQMLIKSGLIS